MQTTPSDPKPRVDWEAVERDYRAGLKSLREIGKQHGVTAAAILKHARKAGWDRDLSAKIKAKAEALVNSAQVNGQVNTVNAVDEQAIITANAEAIVRVKLAHRKDIRRARDHAMRLLEELEQTDDGEAMSGRLETLASALAGAGDLVNAKKVAQLLRSMDLAGRTATMKMLVDTISRLITLERKAFGMDKEDAETDEPDDGFAKFKAMIDRLDGAGTGLRDAA